VPLHQLPSEFFSPPTTQLLAGIVSYSVYKYAGRAGRKLNISPKQEFSGTV
jgi:hypothetical protein